MTDYAILDPEQPVADSVREQLQSAARYAQSWHIVHRPTTASRFQIRVRAAIHALKDLEGELALVHSPGESEDPSRVEFHAAVYDLHANTWLMRSAISGVSDNPKGITELPRVLSPQKVEEPRAAAATESFLEAVKGEFTAGAFRSFVDELQVHEALTAAELWSFPAFLKFVLLEMVVSAAKSLLRSPGAATSRRISVCLKSLSSIGQIEWEELIEPLIAFEAILRQDPSGSYTKMDFESRDFYRRRVAFIARYSDCSETEIAEFALNLALGSAQNGNGDSRLHQRRIHVGYYLIDKGFPKLAHSVGFHPPFAERMRTSIRAHADELYITGIQVLTALIMAAVLFPVLPRASSFSALAVALIFLLLPASQVTVELINDLVTTIFEPEPLPKLDFIENVPVECTTLVAVPTLLLSEDQVRELVANLEIHFLSNRVSNLLFALLTDLPDSVSKPHDNDSHPLVELAIRLVDELNVKYPSRPFLLLHRHRIFNSRQDVWMGWERKRGKLLDLNQLVVGSFDAFPLKAGRVDQLRHVRYIITLDSDTQLPRETAVRLIGAIAHPLNQAIIDPNLGIVTVGYGILQPRVGVAIQSASRSRLAAFYSGQTGFDIYTRAVSDAYQDLFGEGAFTGKGIYEVSTLHAVLDGRFPRNALLSHDLIEGAYARAGLATDIELIDDYPSHYSAYSRRKHRWMRGDWQILQWIFSRVPEDSGRLVPNPLSYISRWKLFDNLRRSLVSPFLFFLFVAGWLGLPGGPLYWTVVPCLLLVFPSLVQLGIGLVRAIYDDRKGSASEALSSFLRSILVTFLELVFLPNQTLVALDAAIRSLVRRFITGKRLLEWETAAQSETPSSRRTPADRYLFVVPFISCGLAALIYLLSPQSNAIFIALPLLLIWSLTNLVTVWLDGPPLESQKRITSIDSDFLLAHALRIWHFFHEFCSERHNFLIPDNVEEDGLFEAPRVSPTNVGMLLNARQAACELGFLTLPEFVELSHKSLATIARLEKFKGHLYNWIDTQSLKPLDAAPFVSSVDSGNFVASLYTLHAGALELRQKPLLARQIFVGLRANWRMMESRNAHLIPARTTLPHSSASINEWLSWLPAAKMALSSAVSSQNAQETDLRWVEESKNRIESILALLQIYLPWMLPEYSSLHEIPQLSIDVNAETPSLLGASAFIQSLEERLRLARTVIAKDPSLLALAEKLRSTLPVALANLRKLNESLGEIAKLAECFAEETDFAFLVHPKRKILSTGYNMGTKELEDSCYDMLASEARIASFLAIARGHMPQKSWFKLARQHALVFGHFLLYSWSGTMFEYLMPALWMRSYPETLISRTLTACVEVQQRFGRSIGIPWGISESGNANMDDSGHYLYHAYGIPQIALRYGAATSRIVSPYSSFLALSVDAGKAMKNLREMESAGWVGAYGFFEAADYAKSPGEVVLVREWMAHHQGMSLLAIVNLLRNNVFQRWFHSNPPVRATELLLHETPVRRAALKAKVKEFGPVNAAPEGLNQ